MPTSDPAPAAKRSLEELYRCAGFLIRRAHQIAVSIFLEESVDPGITTAQYGVMTILRVHPSWKMSSLAPGKMVLWRRALRHS